MATRVQSVVAGMEKARTIFFSKVSARKRAWTKAKGRVVNGSLVLQIDQSSGEQVIPLANSHVDFSPPTSWGEEGPRFCFNLHLADNQLSPVLGAEDEVERETWMRELGGPVSDATFVVEAPADLVWNNLMDHDRTADWSILPGCPVVSRTLVTTRTSGGKVVGHVVIGASADGRTLGTHFQLVELIKETRKLTTEVHVSIIDGAPEIDRSAVREQCLNHCTMTYTSSWTVSPAFDDNSGGGEDDPIRSWCRVRRVVSSLQTVDAAHDLSQPLALASRRENARLAKAWRSTTHEKEGLLKAMPKVGVGGLPVGPLRALDLVAGAIVRSSLDVTIGIIDVTTSGGNGLEENTRSVISTLGAIGTALFLPPAPPANSRLSSPSPRPQSTLEQTKSESRSLIEAGHRRASAATGGSTVEAVVTSRAKVRSGVQVTSGKVGTLAEGSVVVVLDTAVATVAGQESVVRSKVRYQGNDGAVIGWVTSNLLGPRRKESASKSAVIPRPAGSSRDDTASSVGLTDDGRRGLDELRTPRMAGRQISLQRPKIHVSL